MEQYLPAYLMLVILVLACSAAWAGRRTKVRS